jgi:threonine dehydratase
MNLPTYADVVAAEPIVHRHIRPTLLHEWPGLTQLLGCRFYLKHENHTPTTAFKVRGGVHLASRLTDEQRRRGILGCTTGPRSRVGCRRGFGGGIAAGRPRDKSFRFSSTRK